MRAAGDMTGLLSFVISDNDNDNNKELFIYMLIRSQIAN
jgi:hypothetical protein